MKKRLIVFAGAAVFTLGVYGINASWIAGTPDGEMSIMSHRGLHQTYHRVGLTNETCTAERIDPPTHDYMENTIESFLAAIEFGADSIELDVHPTTDGEFAVFHDWTVDCRTEGEGRTRDHSLAELQALDIGYGYTADDGKTYPFRGKFVGMIPTLKEVFRAVPDVDLIINIKSRSKSEAAALLGYIPDNEWQRIGFVGHHAPLDVIAAARPETKGITRRDAKDCMKNYVLKGWYGHVPESCQNTYVPVPKSYTWLVWGWPHKFERRLNAVDSRSSLMGDYDDNGMHALDTIDDLRAVPEGYTGIVFTNKIEVVGPILKNDP